MTLFPKCHNHPTPPPFPFCGPWAPREAKWPSRARAPRDADPRPWHLPHSGTAPQLPQEGPRCQAAEAEVGGWMATRTAAPQAPRPGSFHPAAQLPAHPPGPRHQSTPGPLLPLSFLPSSSLPNLSLFFFSSPLSLPTCHYSRNKKRGDNAGIDGSPLPPPPPSVRASTLSTRPGLEPLPKEPC